MGNWTEGLTIGRYCLLRRLGAGSFAEVWLAEERGAIGFSKKVAVKLLKGSDPSDEKVATFLQEARLAASLRHPNIVDIQRVEEIDGTLLVAMEYMDGGTLSELVQAAARSGLTIPRSVVVDLGLDIVRALGQAHDGDDVEGAPRCIVHRDLKPANVLLDRSGIAKVTDFGIAKAVGDATATAAGALKGTPAYIAPESWELQREFLPRVDLFSVGCILWELVQLQRLFQGDSVAVIFRQIAQRPVEEEIEPIEGRFPELAPILERLLQRVPEERYQDAFDVVADLQDIRATMSTDGSTREFLELLAMTDDTAGVTSRTPIRGTRLSSSADPAWAAAVDRSSTGRFAVLSEADRHSAPSARWSPSGTTEVGVEPGPSRPPVDAATLVDEQSTNPSSRGPNAASPTRGTQSVIVAPAEMTSVGRRRRSTPTTVFAVAALLCAATVFVALRGDRGADRAVPADGTADASGPRRADGVPSAESSDPRPLLEDLPAAAGGRPDVALPLGAVAEVPELPIEEPSQSTEPAGSPAEPTAVEPARESHVIVVAPEPAAAGEATAPPAPEEVATAGPTVAPLPTANHGCLVLTSKPPGARVWLDGVALSDRARSTPSRGRRTGPTSVSVAMGSGSEPAASVQVRVEAGEGVRVDCDLLTRNVCSLSTAPIGICGD